MIDTNDANAQASRPADAQIATLAQTAEEMIKRFGNQAGALGFSRNENGSFNVTYGPGNRHQTSLQVRTLDGNAISIIAKETASVIRDGKLSDKTLLSATKHDTDPEEARVILGEFIANPSQGIRGLAHFFFGKTQDQFGEHTDGLLRSLGAAVAGATALEGKPGPTTDGPA